MLRKGVAGQLQLHDGGFGYVHLRHGAAVRHRAGAAPACAGCGRAGCCADFAAALNDLLLDLALQVIRDGEGASKLVRIDVTGATTARSAKRIAMAVANSPLVKTAIAGEDANWGRIVMAVGKAGEPADRDKLSIAVGRGVDGAGRGRRAGLRRDAGGRAYEGARDRISTIDIGLGRGKATVWTCDLTHGYIDINGSYRS